MAEEEEVEEEVETEVEEEAMEEDPMGMSGPMEDEDIMVLSKLFGKGAGEEEEEEEEEVEEEEEEEVEEEAKKKARLQTRKSAPVSKAASAKAPVSKAASAKAPVSKAASAKAPVRPQPKSAPNGATRLGGVKVASSSDREVDELSKLWNSAPDVSKYF
jgi:outer membrane biosynthesis protein TonB